MHPWDFVAGRVSHEVQEEGVFIHHSRISVKFGHLMGFVEFAMRLALQDDVAHDLLVTAVVPEVRRAVFQREAIRILQDLLGPWRIFEKKDASILRRNALGKILANMQRLRARKKWFKDFSVLLQKQRVGIHPHDSTMVAQMV
jgi:hypothetical protein